jgi:acyl-CoA thioesterase I
MMKKGAKAVYTTGLILFAAACQLHAGQPRLTLYFPFDGNVTPQAAAPTEFKLDGSVPVASYVEGVKGQAVLLNGHQLWGPTAGNLAASQGTVCFWAKPVEWDPQQPETTWRTFWILSSVAPGTQAGSSGYTQDRSNDYVSFWRYPQDMSKAWGSIGAYNYAAQARALSNMIFDIKDWKRGEWRFFAMSWGQDGTDRLYQNGRLSGWMPRTRDSVSANLNYLSIVGGGSILDEVKVFDTALSEAEVMQEYLGKSVATTSGKRRVKPDKFLADALRLIGPQPAGELLIKSGDKVSFIGDSITQNGGYLRVVAHVLKINRLDLNLSPFINAGISANRAEDMAPRFEHDTRLSEKPAWVFISVGVNDVHSRLKDDKNIDLPHDPKVLEAYAANVKQMVEKGQAVGARVVLLTPTIIQEDPNSEGNMRLALYVATMKRIAAETKCAVVDLHGLFLNALANQKTPVRLTVDGIHMSIYGDAIMGIGVLRAMGVSDKVVAATDVTSVIQFHGLMRGMPVADAAELLEVPAKRLLTKPELQSLVSF